MESLKQIRIGNDIRILWFIKHNKEPYNLEGKDLVVTLRRGQTPYPVAGFTIDGNTIEFVFQGKDQQMAGTYFLTLEENKGELGMHTVDSCPAFKLVTNSCYIEPGKSGSNIQIESVELTSFVEGGVSGPPGRGVKKIVGSPDGSWTIYYTDGTEETVSNEAYMALKRDLGQKVDKEEGKGLSTEDFTSEEKEKLAGLGGQTEVTKESVEKVLTGDITTHNHATQLAEALTNYVQKVAGKGLSTEDFTTMLKLKLEGLDNYDDTAVQEAITNINGRIDTLVGTSASEAIDNFKEIEAFLAGITDKQSLTGLLNDLRVELTALIPTTLAELGEDAGHQTVSGADKENWNNKVDKVDGEGLISDTEKQRLAGVDNYDDTQIRQEIGDKQPKGDYALKDEIPTTLAQLTDDADHRLVTDVEKETWNNKSDFDGDYNSLTNRPTIPSGSSEEIEVNDTGEQPTTEGIKMYVDFSKTTPDLVVVPEAPQDGKSYIRRDGAWYQVDLALLTFMDGINAVTSLASLPIDKRSIVATVTSATTISLSSALKVGQDLYIRVVNNSDAAITQLLPTDETFTSMSGESIEIPSKGFVEISIWCYEVGKYSIRAGGLS